MSASEPFSRRGSGGGGTDDEDEEEEGANGGGSGNNSSTPDDDVQARGRGQQDPDDDSDGGSNDGSEGDDSGRARGEGDDSPSAFDPDESDSDDGGSGGGGGEDGSTSEDTADGDGGGQDGEGSGDGQQGGESQAQAEDGEDAEADVDRSNVPQDGARGEAFEQLDDQTPVQLGSEDVEVVETGDGVRAQLTERGRRRVGEARLEEEFGTDLRASDITVTPGGVTLSEQGRRRIGEQRLEEQLGVDLSADDITVTEEGVRLSEQGQRRIGAQRLEDQLDTDLAPSDVTVTDEGVRLSEEAQAEIIAERREDARVAQQVSGALAFEQREAREAATEEVQETIETAGEVSGALDAAAEADADDGPADARGRAPGRRSSTFDGGAVADLERQVEEQTGADLQAGRDFTVSETEDGQLQAELTEEGQRRAAQAQQEPVELDVPVVGEVSIGGGDAPADLGEREQIRAPRTVPIVGGEAVTVVPERVTLDAPTARDVARVTELGGGTPAGILVGAAGVTAFRELGLSETGQTPADAEGPTVAEVPEEVANVPLAGEELETVGSAQAQGASEFFTGVEEAAIERFGLEDTQQTAVVAGDGEQASTEVQLREQAETVARDVVLGATTETASVAASTPGGLLALSENTAEAGLEAAEGDLEAGDVETAGEQVAAQAARQIGQNPARSAGTLIGTAALIGGAGAISGGLGRGTAFLVQPGEEIASATLSRAAPRIARRFPNDRIDNEEIVIRGVSRGGQRVVAAGRTAARGVQARTPEVALERAPDRGFLEVNASRPELSASLSRPTLERPAVDVDRPNVSVTSRPVETVRDRAASARETVGARAQGAAINQELRQRRAQAAARNAVQRLRDTPASAGDVAERARTGVRDAVQTAALEAEIRTFNLRRRAAALRERVTSTPDLSAPSAREAVGDRLASAELEARAARAAARERLASASPPEFSPPSPREVVGDRLASAELEVRAARAQLSELDLTPSFDLQRPSASEFTLRDLGDLTLRIGARDAGSGRRTLTAGDVQDVPLDLETPRNTDVEADARAESESTDGGGVEPVDADEPLTFDASEGSEPVDADAPSIFGAADSPEAAEADDPALFDADGDGDAEAAADGDGGGEAAAATADGESGVVPVERERERERPPGGGDTELDSGRVPATEREVEPAGRELPDAIDEAFAVDAEASVEGARAGTDDTLGLDTEAATSPAVDQREAQTPGAGQDLSEDVGVDTERRVETDTETDTGLGVESETETEIDSETELELEQEIETETELETEAETEFELEAEAARLEDDPNEDDDRARLTEEEEVVLDLPEFPTFGGDDVFEQNDGDANGEADPAAAGEQQQQRRRGRRRRTSIDDVSDGLAAATTGRDADAARRGGGGDGASAATARRAATAADPNGDVDTFGDLGPDDGDVFAEGDGDVTGDDLFDDEGGGLL